MNDCYGRMSEWLNESETVELTQYIEQYFAANPEIVRAMLTCGPPTTIARAAFMTGFVTCVMLARSTGEMKDLTLWEDDEPQPVLRKVKKK